MVTPTHYNFRIILKPKRNKKSQLISIDQQPQQVATTFPVIFFLDKREVPIYSPGRMAFFATNRRPELISHKVIHIPVGDSLCHHIRDFKEILIDMSIFGIKQSVILFEIATKARGIDTCNGVIMVVGITKTIYREIRVYNEDDIARAERESMEVEAKPIPATKSSIDALERVVFDGSASERDCTVCMEKIEAASEAIRLPCSHVYHSDCIVRWLQMSHLCPLCRYHMPCEF